MSLDRTTAFRAKVVSAQEEETEERTAQEATRDAELEQLRAQHPEVVALLKSDDGWFWPRPHEPLPEKKAPEGCFFLFRGWYDNQDGRGSGRTFWKLKVVEASVREVIDKIIKLENTGMTRTTDDISGVRFFG